MNTEAYIELDNMNRLLNIPQAVLHKCEKVDGIMFLDGDHISQRREVDAVEYKFTIYIDKDIKDE